MIGIAYLLEEQAAVVREKIRRFSQDSRYDGSFWEEALYQKDRMIVAAKVVHSAEVVEVNTYEQLRELDENSDQLKTEAIETISEALGVKGGDVTDITILKKGMTNRSFLFRCNGKRYIMRIPGEGTDQLINRGEEASVYQAVTGKGICDDVIYINQDNGYKITEYLEEARVCDPMCMEDVSLCMEQLRRFHRMELSAGHEFDLFRQIEFYESLWKGAPLYIRIIW